MPNGLYGAFGGKTVSDENVAPFCLERPLNNFSEKHVFGPNFFYKNTPKLFSGPNGLYDAIGGKIVPEQSFVFPKKHIFDPNFFTKLPPQLFLGPNGLHGAFGGKIVSDKNFAPFGLERPRNLFSEIHVFCPNFFYENASQLFSGWNGLYGAIGGKIVLKWSFVSPKKHVFDPNFFTKPSLHLFSGPNELYGVFGSQTVSGENFTPFCLERPQNRFFEKHVFDLNFFTKTHLSYFRGQTDYMGAIEGKLVLERSFVALKKHVFVLNFFTKLPPHLFSGPNGLCGAFWGKTVSDENFAPFFLKRPRNCFSEKHVFGPNFIWFWLDSLFHLPSSLYFLRF